MNGDILEKKSQVKKSSTRQRYQTKAQYCIIQPTWTSTIPLLSVWTILLCILVTFKNLYIINLKGLWICRI